MLLRHNLFLCQELPYSATNRLYLKACPSVRDLGGHPYFLVAEKGLGSLFSGFILPCPRMRIGWPGIVKNVLKSINKC